MLNRVSVVWSNKEYYYSTLDADASPSQGIQHEATKSITTLPGWDAIFHHRVPSMKQQGVSLLYMDGMLVDHRVPSMK